MPIVGIDSGSGSEFQLYTADTQLASKFTMPEGGTITRMGFKGRSASGTINSALALYTNGLDSGSGKYAPKDIVGFASISLGPTSVFRDVSGLNLHLDSGDFWIKLVCDNNYYIDYVSGAVDQVFACWGRTGISPFTFPDNFLDNPQNFTGSEGWDSAQFLMFIEYTPDVNAETRMIITPIGLSFLGGTNLQNYPDSVLIESGMPLTYLGGTYISGISDFNLSGDVNSAPGTIQESINVIAPVVTGSSNFSSSPINESINVISPTVKASALFSPALLQISINSISPIVKGDSMVSVFPIESILNTISPDVRSHALFNASEFSNLLNVIIPSAIGSSLVLADPIDEILMVISPIVIGGSQSNIDPISSNLLSIIPVVVGYSNISADQIQEHLNVINPSVIGNSKFEALAIQEILSIISPNVSGASNVSVNNVNLQIVVIAPTVTGGGIVYFGQLKYWNGTTWVKAKLRVKVNGVWLKWAMRIKVNNEWILVDSD